MIRSPLIAPLVKPLVAPRPGLAGASRLSGGSLGMSALALSALVAVSTAAPMVGKLLEAESLKSRKVEKVVANAHRAPARPSAQVVLDRFLASLGRLEDEAGISVARGSAPGSLEVGARLSLAGLGRIDLAGPPPIFRLSGPRVLRHARPDPVLAGSAVPRWQERLRSASTPLHPALAQALSQGRGLSFVLFGSGTHLSGLPTT